MGAGTGNDAVKGGRHRAGTGYDAIKGDRYGGCDGQWCSKGGQAWSWDWLWRSKGGTEIKEEQAGSHWLQCAKMQDSGAIYISDHVQAEALAGHGIRQLHSATQGPMRTMLSLALGCSPPDIENHLLSGAQSCGLKVWQTDEECGAVKTSDFWFSLV